MSNGLLGVGGHIHDGSLPFLNFRDDADEKAKRWVENPPWPGTLMMRLGA